MTLYIAEYLLTFQWCIQYCGLMKQRFSKFELEAEFLRGLKYFFENLNFYSIVFVFCSQAAKSFLGFLMNWLL